MADIFTPKGLGELLGAPMIAMIQGESLAAKTTAQFIREVGFEKTDEPENDFGALKLVTFSYQKQDAEGKPETFEIKIPLLSIIPIPALQIKNATIAMAVQLTGFEPDDDNEPELKTNKPQFLKTPSFGMLGFVARKQTAPASTSETSKSNFSMDIRIELEQADMTLGLQNILGVMERGLQETKKVVNP